jgi:hypothetical protein
VQTYLNTRKVGAWLDVEWIYWPYFADIFYIKDSESNVLGVCIEKSGRNERASDVYYDHCLGLYILLISLPQ